MIAGVLRQFADYVEAGGWVMPPLVLCTLLLWFAIGYRFAALKRGSKRGVRNLLRRHEEKGRQPNNDGVLVRALARGTSIRDSRPNNLRALLDDAFSDEQQEIQRFNTLIMTIVLSAPLLGLLGTVVGMIETFDSLGDMSLFSQSGGIAGGISQALITTQMGLAVAIPGLIVNGMLHRKQKDIELELAQLKDMLCSDYRNNPTPCRINRP
ncbi:MotA/TolQ/ExbB proton channel family protein [Elongatibacter sediminis]|uniref:MotA/TolQ/ExbB proton channel family protein n=1 Tax=Elongatibacter sediminis TaxID=3119006 RepID=A0AAW9RHT8_9GAMM